MSLLFAFLGSLSKLHCFKDLSGWMCCIFLYLWVPVLGVTSCSAVLSVPALICFPSLMRLLDYDYEKGLKSFKASSKLEEMCHQEKWTLGSYKVCIDMLAGNDLNYSNLEITLSHCTLGIGYKNIWIHFFKNYLIQETIMNATFAFELVWTPGKCNLKAQVHLCSVYLYWTYNDGVIAKPLKWNNLLG